ncbi:MAG TPA: hypothetical protein VMR89_12915 [Actinomycetota bacterium]|nr:hypothetical protein [Actinomycetota bacterium]
MIELILSVTLMFLVVGLAARWALRNGLRERFRGRPLDEFSGRGG